MYFSGVGRPLSLFLLVLPALVLAACGDGSKETATTAARQPDGGRVRVASGSVQDALRLVEGVYSESAADISVKAPRGVFSFSAAGPEVPSDLSYLSGRITMLLDETSQAALRLTAGNEAATFLVAGYGTTQRPEFSMAAHTVIDYLRDLIAKAAGGTAGESQLFALEQQLTAFEIACGCQR